MSDYSIGTREENPFEFLARNTTLEEMDNDNSSQVSSMDIYLNKKQAVRNLKEIVFLLEEEWRKEEDLTLKIYYQQQIQAFSLAVKFKMGEINQFVVENKKDNRFEVLENKLEKLDEKISKIVLNQESTSKVLSSKSYAEVLKNNNNTSKIREEKQNRQKAISVSSTKTLMSLLSDKEKPKPKVFFTNKERRLVVKVKSNQMHKINLLHIRNELNNAIFSKIAINQESPVIGSIQFSASGVSLIITTTENYSAEFLTQNKESWEPKLRTFLEQEQNLQISADETWYMIVVHGITTYPFLDEKEGLAELKQEIELFNSDIKMKKNPVWLSSRENRTKKAYASALLFLDKNPEKKYLNIAGIRCKTEEYQNKNPRTIQYKQCFNCWKFGHSSVMCRNLTRCLFCSKNHKTYDHKCDICNIKEESCHHTSFKCVNCQENHQANHKACTLFKIPLNQEEKLMQKIEKSKSQPYAEEIKKRKISVVISPLKC